MSAAETEAELAAGVRAVLAEVGEDPGELDLSPIPGGASRETWLVEGRRRPLGPAPGPAGVGLAGRRWREEFALVAAASAAGVPVPEPLAFEPEGGRFGSPGMLMAFVEGTSVAPRVLRKPEYEAARGALPAQLAEALARIHSLPAAAVADVLPPAPADPALEQIAEWERQLDEIGEPLPAVELGLRWLRANAPEPAEPRLVHGDFRLGNFIVDEDGPGGGDRLGAGPPRRPRRGHRLALHPLLALRQRRAAGGRGRRRWTSSSPAYEAAGGGAVDPRARPLLGGLRQRQVGRDLRPPGARPPDAGNGRSHELASLGRRICEPEWDMLELMRGEAAMTQDRPDAPELLEAVAEYLFAELRPEVPSEQRFRVLVAANVCAVVARELRAGEAPDSRRTSSCSASCSARATRGARPPSWRGGSAARASFDDRLDELADRLAEHVRASSRSPARATPTP